MISDKKKIGFNKIKTMLYNDDYRLRICGINYFDHILDIGANIGVFSILSTVLYPEAKIHAYEPCKKTYEYLKQNVDDIKLEEL